MRINLWVAAGFAAALIGCNQPTYTEEGGGEESSGAPAELEIHDFFIAAETAYCGWATRCGAFDSADGCHAVEFFDVSYPDGLLASARLHDGSQGALVKYLLESYEGGRIEFDGEAAATCLAYVEGRGCDRPWTYEPTADEVAGRAACDAVFRGTMTRNGPCILSMECAHEETDTAVCGFDPTCVEACCAGGCRVLVAPGEGESCNNTAGCQAGLYCAIDPNTFQPTVCTRQKALGQPCGSGNECADGGYCDFNSNACARPAKVGEPCFDVPCEEGSYCVDLQNNGDARCLGFGGLGDPCVYEDGCRPLNATCDWQASQCVELPKAGSACSQSGQPCASSAFCDWNSNTCVARAVEGEACGWIGGDFDGKYVQCAGALLCDEANTARCEAPIAGNTCAVPELTPLPGEG